jgi:BNR repeat-like domain
MNEITRRQFVIRCGAAAGVSLLSPPRSYGIDISTGLQLKSKEVFIPNRNNTGVFPGFVTYIDSEKPRLLHRFGWVDASDTYDNFHEMISEDNGVSWSDPVLKVKSIPVDGGLIRYIENAAYFDDASRSLLTFVSKSFYPNGKFDSNQSRTIEVTRRNPKTGETLHTQEVDFGQRGGMGCSFCFPIKTRSGRLVVPVFSARVNEQNEFIHHPKSRSNIYEVYMMLGAVTDTGAIDWKLSEAVRADDDRSTRGFSESTPIQLRDGRLAILCRGSNAGAPDISGYKWLCFSEDDGDTWTQPVPMTCSDGSAIESSATGSALFRSIKNGKVYFIGNLCADGKRANGNWPRSPLHIAAVDEDTVSIHRDTITVVDERAGSDTERTQISNFRYYQDRETGDVVIFATRFGENEIKNWKRANYYRYRVAIG